MDNKDGEEDEEVEVEVAVYDGLDNDELEARR